MDEKRALLIHFLAALAYRTQKALRGAPEGFASFRAAPKVRTPHELVCHMNSVLGYAGTFFLGGSYRVPQLPEFGAEVERLHSTLAALARLVWETSDWRDITPERLLQGPLSDVMAHAGQLAMLRRLAGCPVPPENFVFAEVDPANLGPDQPLPASPDEEWPERP
ncbi:MAG: hypothetical protein A2Y78_07000 [Acidobacteria bacterium RBG_13_68_16]|nr:MAG: hypothetical protein A2Y78_07000 [Acidobacteria bacterium RBG_13_68_16]